jgi:hypothetical protein
MTPLETQSHLIMLRHLRGATEAGGVTHLLTIKDAIPETPKRG